MSTRTIKNPVNRVAPVAPSGTSMPLSIYLVFGSKTPKVASVAPLSYLLRIEEKEDLYIKGGSGAATVATRQKLRRRAREKRRAKARGGEGERDRFL